MSGHASGDVLAPMPFDLSSVVTNGLANPPAFEGETLPFSESRLTQIFFFAVSSKAPKKPKAPKKI